MATLTATFAAAEYEAREGGPAVEVAVNLSPAADRAVSLPITVTPASGAEAKDYTVSAAQDVGRKTASGVYLCRLVLPDRTVSRALT